MSYLSWLIQKVEFVKNLSFQDVYLKTRVRINLTHAANATVNASVGVGQEKPFREILFTCIAPDCVVTVENVTLQ